MTPDAGKLAAVADLPSFTVEVGELDLVELAQRGLVGPELRLTAAAQARLGEVGTFVVRDVEATPLLLAERHGAQVRTSPLRPVESILSEPEPAELTVVVHSLPSAQELAELSTRAGWGTRVTWLVLAGRTQAGRRLLHEVTDLVPGGPGTHQVVRVPWPNQSGTGLFELPPLPDPEALAASYGGRGVVDVGTRPSPGAASKGRGGAVLFFTGLSGSGKSTVAKAVHEALELRTEREVTLLDGDDVRRLLSAGLGFDAAGREANVRRVSWVAALLARGGGIAITALIAPFAKGRAEARGFAEPESTFLEVWVSTPLEECERRDRKGLYAQARAGKIPEFTGISSPYEAPTHADVVIDTTEVGLQNAVEIVLAALAAKTSATPAASESATSNEELERAHVS